MEKLFRRAGFLLITALMIAGITACDEEGTEVSSIVEIAAGASAAEQAQLAFIEAEEGQIIVFGEGQFDFSNTLSMDGKTNIIIKGAGREKTILDFNGQTSGGEGMLITNSTNIKIEGLTVRDSRGDALKTRDVSRVSFIDVGTIWSGEPDSGNGAYGLYPVLCSEVYIDGVYAYGASDAGIYVGQSDKVILKNSVAEGNVAGIEIENTTNADVFDNEAFDNTGGILVFDLPGLTKTGNSVRIFNNNVHDNNRTNFAPPGNIVGNVPAGTGSMILSTKGVEVFDNTFTGNNFAGVMVASYLFVNSDPKDNSYNPFPDNIYIHGNSHQMTGAPNLDQPEAILPIMGLMQLYQLTPSDILLDGIFLGNGAICIQEGSASFINMGALDQTFQSVTTDVSVHDCSRESLPAVVFDPFL